MLIGGVKTANTLMLSLWMGLVCVKNRMESFVTIVVHVCTLRINKFGDEKKAGFLIPCFLCL